MKRDRLITLLSVTALLLVPIATSALYYNRTANVANNFDATTKAFDNSIQFTQPKNWSLIDGYDTVISGSRLDFVELHDISESQSRLTREVVIYKSDAAGIFRLSPSLSIKLSEKDMVNLFMYQNLLSSIGGRLMSAKITTIGGQSMYSLEWSELRRGGIRFVVSDNFVFNGKDVYQIHGEYADYDATYRTPVRSVIDSFKIQ